MTTFTDVAVSDLFEGRNGKAIFVKDYLDKHPGKYPVYSASLEKPFGFVDSFDFDGTFLTWVMNGYGGRVREVSGKFSANRDRGVLLPRAGVTIPDLTYLRYAMEPVFVAAAVGRRVDGRRNDYTKLYPEEALAQRIQIPVDKRGGYDYAKMVELGSRLRRIEAAQAAVRKALEDVLSARVTIESLVSSDDA
ncbi:MAG TPA: restriction endonuclease subunit S [Polyangiaceae bacterium]|nr:restriction endonuclease subunit S [Polyangiaceae bacterium]